MILRFSSQPDSPRSQIFRKAGQKKAEPNSAILSLKGDNTSITPGFGGKTESIAYVCQDPFSTHMLTSHVYIYIKRQCNKGVKGIRVTLLHHLDHSILTSMIIKVRWN
jgi:hypothetical protein